MRHGADLLSAIAKLLEAVQHRGLRAPAYVIQVLAGRLKAWRTRRAIAGAYELSTKFSLIYRSRWWDKQGESASGPGSTLDFPRPFREGFSAILRDRQIKTLFDAPCGDWNWFKEVELPADLSYTGGEVVAELTAALQQRYGRNGCQFRTFDITRDAFPGVDLWLCRDCLAHLSNADVAAALRNFVRSDVPYAMLSSYRSEGVNDDIASGGFRPLDLTKPPFSLPEPEFAINDWPDDENIRRVGLWSREQIAAAGRRLDRP